MQEPDWPVNKDWQKGQSRPEQVNLRFYVAAGFILVYLGTLGVLNVHQWSRIAPSLERFISSGFSHFDPLLMLPAIFLVGLLGVPRVLREFVRWRRHCGLVMMLDPIPVALDGELGGRLTIPLNVPPGEPVHVTLNCMRRVVTHGKNASVRDELLWRMPAAVRQLRSIKGTRVEFCLELSPLQPQTSFVEGKRDVWWAVRVEAVQGSIDATFAVPVSAHSTKTRSGIHFSEQERANALEAGRTPVRSWRASGSGEEVSINYPSGRSGKAAGILFVVGLVFTAVVVFMGYNLYEELESARKSYFSIMVQGMILFGFSLFGPPFLLFSVYMLFNRLTLNVSTRELVTTRHFLGMAWIRRVSVDEVEGIAERIVGRVGQGVESELEYAVDAYLKDGRRVRLGDGIHGQAEAEQLLEQLYGMTGISYRPDPSAYRLKRRPAPGWVKWMPLGFKLISMLVFGVTIAAFVLDFM